MLARNTPPVRTTMLAMGCLAAMSLAGCGRAADRAAAAQTPAAGSAKTGGVSVCALMPKEAVNAAIGTAYTTVEASDESSSSSCHYSTATDPAGLSLNLQWIEPSEYSSPAEHAALQAAGMGGAKLGGKLTAQMAPEAISAGDGPLHIHSGPVEGVGDEATQSLLLLTARKGDYLLMVQIFTDPMTLIQDSTAGPKTLEHERTIARSLFSKV